MQPIKITQKVIKWMIITSLLISVAAITVGILALTMKQYLIAGVMGVLTIYQIWNCRQWMKKRKG